MVLILGVTASGKGQLAFGLAESLGAEIISIDSMKVYRRMDIGTGKPPKEARERITYHLIDVVEPSDAFSVAAFLDLANIAIGQIESRKRPIIAVGGTALYLKALLYGLFEGPGTDEQIRGELQARAETEGAELYRELAAIDPAAAERISPNDTRRIIRALEVYKITGKPISSFQNQFNAQEPLRKWTIIGLRREKAEESKRINTRVKRMISAGLVDEVKSLLAEEKPLSRQAGCAIGYKEIIDHLSGRTTLEDAVELIKKNTRRLAKNQRTWFKTFANVNWLDIETGESVGKILSRARTVIESLES
ncbi:MAG: tRNA (adenosine(37)-N6)-dimethylallyltransferase MiaA [Phycisphaerae bacterium]|nr:tRNA (adenosine(37)-N6)-dimethylallyltransferase MiaA [Phycisphaerae bacterium]NIP50851.1 tRNA (adenosine(37)-N6)-dimethylallyltransferase MiaA [Phycisphaerae bacterium]NIS51367.1 tRNA (adenosine(37)-N6)-dimethylallyltransferase MiaA [Phycisphaerae bacterium]NIU08979.1 tRNA (adenosine(37)-N6)-dimethylallyltransferase MiaA [Phycisphaerae bacterium]NIU55347.1 tRNA (adenosine(37)-N6)-dimethylallyltransferase MiaA [Phycisphaerae bacterium]